MLPERIPLALGLSLLLPTIALMAQPGLTPPSPAPPAEPIFRLDLSGSAPLAQGLSWVPAGPSGENCLRIEVPPEGRNRAYLVTVPIDLKPLRGCEIELSYAVKAEGVSPPEKDYNGIKCQLHWVSPLGGPRWHNEGRLSGTFDWRRSSMRIRVDPDASDGTLQVGMQDSSGVALLAEVAITVLQKMPGRPAPAADAPEPFRGHSLPRLRGVVGPGIYDPKDLDDLASWNVNVIRWQLVNPEWDRTAIPGDPATYGPWLIAKLNELALVLDRAQALGIKVIVDLHAPPGGRLPDGTQRMFLEKPLQSYFIRIWKHIAQRFKGHPALFGYDLMNEPLQMRPSPPGLLDWFDLQAATARVVRENDPATPILLSVDQWDSPEAFAWMRPVNVPNVIYTVHVYWPNEYTHQGIDRPWASDADRPVYPGTFNGEPFDRAALVKQLAPVREFQLAYNVQIFVGEFSTVRWAPGGAQYLADCISIFEEYGWDWTYHAYREWPGWSVEHADLPYDADNHPHADQPTERYRVIRAWFDKNEH